MRYKPPHNRSRLRANAFKLMENGEWYLRLENFYAVLFDERLPHVINRSKSGWNDGGDVRYAYFTELTEGEKGTIKQFVSDYVTYIFLDLNPNISSHFTDELDVCMALDFNFVREGSGRKHTDVGQLVHNAKWKQDKSAIKQLVSKLEYASMRLPISLRSADSLITCIPVNAKKKFDLPTEIVKLLEPLVRNTLTLCESNTIIHSTLLCDKPDAKDESVAYKIKMWQDIYKNSSVELSASVDGSTVYIVDDLYQSGSTIWAYAKFLREQGAKTVIGLVCEKTWSDTDNQ